jgi:hypothetical protein
MEHEDEMCGSQTKQLLHYRKVDYVYYPGVQQKDLQNHKISLRIDWKPIVIPMVKVLMKIVTECLTVGLISENRRGESEYNNEYIRIASDPVGTRARTFFLS